MTDLLLTPEMAEAYARFAADRKLVRRVMRQRAQAAYVSRDVARLRECRERFA